MAGIAGWLGASTDTVPLGLILITVDDLTEVGRRHGDRVRMHTEQNIADLIREDLRPLDQAVRLGTGEFLLVQPALGSADLTERSLRLERRLGALHATYPFVDLHPRTTTMLTRKRPLPVHSLRAQLKQVPTAALWPPSHGMLPSPNGGGTTWFR